MLFRSSFILHPSVPPRRPLAEVLAAFLEERNIRWGEIIGGMLIVGCSIALVLSLWDRIQGIPYFPFFGFVGINTALFGMALYSLRWKLESTTRGLLTISTLLVPLNFLAMAGLSRGEAEFLPMLLEAASLGLFAFLVDRAGRVLTPDARGPLVGAVVGTSAAQLVVSRLVDPASSATVFALASFLPVGAYAAAVGLHLRRAADRRPFSISDAGQLFSLLGIAVFALATALGLLVYSAGEGFAGVSRMALPLSPAALPILAAGLLIHRGMTRDEDTASWRTAGTAVGLAGLILIVLSVVLAWPRPEAITGVGVLNFVGLTVIAFRGRLPIAHGAAIASLLMAWWAGYPWIMGRLDPALEPGARLRDALLHGGPSLVSLFALLTVAAEALHRAGRKVHGTAYALGAMAIALLSLGLVTFDGSDRPLQASAVYAAYAVGILLLNVRVRAALPTQLALMLLVGSSLWLLHHQAPGNWSLWSAVLAIEALALSVVSAILRPAFDGPPQDEPAADADPRIGFVRGPLSTVANMVALTALVFAGVHVHGQWQPAFVIGGGAALFTGWLVIAGAGLTAALTLLALVEAKPGTMRTAMRLALLAVAAGAGWLDLPLAPAVSGAGAAFALATLLLGSKLIADATGVEVASTEATRTDAPVGGTDIPVCPPSTLADRVGMLYLPMRQVAGVAVAVAALFTWPSSPAFAEPFHTWSAALAAVALFLLAPSYSKPVLTVLGSLAALASIQHALRIGPAVGWAERPVMTGLLLHATLALLAVPVFTLLRRFFGSPDGADAADRLFGRPLSRTALAVSIAAAPLMFDVSSGSRLSLAGNTLWLAALWAIAAWANRWPSLLAGAQVAMFGSALFASAAWAELQPWFPGYSAAFVDPRFLQAAIASVAALALLWVPARQLSSRNDRLAALLDSGWARVDRLMLGLAAVGLTAVSAIWAYSAEKHELASYWGPWPDRDLFANAFGPIAAVAVASVFVAILAALWERATPTAWAGLVMASACAAGVGAFPQFADRSLLPALTGALSIVFLGSSALLWLRPRRWLPNLDRPASVKAVRITSAVVALAPALLWAADALSERWSAILVGVYRGFSADKWAELDLPPILPLLVPPIILAAALAGSAWRERSAVIAFCAGLVVTAVAGFAYITLALDPLRFEIAPQFGEIFQPLFVGILLWSSLAAALWSIAWLLLPASMWATRSAFREGEAPAEPRSPGSADPVHPSSFILHPLPRTHPLLTLNLVLPAVGVGLLLILSALTVALASPPFTRWAEAVGSPLGWAAALAVGAGFALRKFRTGAAGSPDSLAAGTWALATLVACSVARVTPDWAYRALMLSWAVGSLTVVCGAWLTAIVRSRSATFDLAAFATTAGKWLGIVAASSIALALKLAFDLDGADDHWAAAAVAVAASAGAVMAVWSRREGWAFVSGLGINLAVTLVVRHRNAHLPLEVWRVWLIQANVIASSVGAILWIAARNRILRSASTESGPLLSLQVVLGLLGNLALLALPAWLLIERPFDLHPNIAEAGTVWGWVALGVASAAALLHVGQTAARSSTHVLMLLGLALGVLSACSTAPFDIGDWLAFHTLIAACFVVASAAAIVAARAAANTALSLRSLRCWASIAGAVVVLLAVRAAGADPAAPVSTAGAAMAVAILFGSLALSSTHQRYVYLCGAAVAVAAGLYWWTLPTATDADLARLLVAALASASAAWTLIELRLLRRDPPVDLRGSSLPFSQSAGMACVAALAVSAFLQLMQRLGGSTESLGDATLVAAVVASAVAALISCWDRTSIVALRGLYVVALSALVLGLTAEPTGAKLLARNAAVGLSLLIALVGSVAALASRFGLRDRLRLADLPDQSWLLPTQVALALPAIALGLYTACLGTEPLDRLLGAAAVSLLVPVGAFAASAEPRAALRYAVLLLGVGAISAWGWALLDPTDSAVWLYRTILLTVTAGAATPLFGVALPRFLGDGSPWGTSGRRLGPILFVVTWLLPSAVLAQEWNLAQAQVEVALPAVLIVVAALVALMVAGVGFAVAPGADPLGLSLRGRTLYVYAAEVLLVLVFVHLKFTMPHLFTSGLFARYWPFALMAIAFVGAGAGEFFHRQGLPVLAEPLQRTGLFLPLLPAIGFWLIPDPGRFVGVWFLAGGLYASMAAAKRSFGFALLAAASANIGIWVILSDRGFSFVDHPQLWLIPFALAVLGAEHVNRERLGRNRANSIRYAASSVMYLSSAIEMFRDPEGVNVWRPLILAGLAVLGMFAGIILRVRAFLMLGAVFLLLSVFTMIWHAAVDREQTWVWYVSGIGLGVFIIALFAVFEKRRNDILRVLDSIRKWA